MTRTVMRNVHYRDFTNKNRLEVTYKACLPGLRPIVYLNVKNK